MTKSFDVIENTLLTRKCSWAVRIHTNRVNYYRGGFTDEKEAGIHADTVRRALGIKPRYGYNFPAIDLPPDSSLMQWIEENRK